MVTERERGWKGERGREGGGGGGIMLTVDSAKTTKF